MIYKKMLGKILTLINSLQQKDFFQSFYLKFFIKSILKRKKIQKLGYIHDKVILLSYSI